MTSTAVLGGPPAPAPGAVAAVLVVLVVQPAVVRPALAAG